nr:MAG TPA: hypothetical protein [Caudoviricetes sp.]
MHCIFFLKQYFIRKICSRTIWCPLNIFNF